MSVNVRSHLLIATTSKSVVVIEPQDHKTASVMAQIYGNVLLLTLSCAVIGTLIL